MRPCIFKLMDAAQDEAARFSAWVKARGLAVDDWITLFGRDSNGDKHGGARVLLDDSGAIVYGLGGRFEGKKIGEAFNEIKQENAQGALFSEVRTAQRKADRQRWKQAKEQRRAEKETAQKQAFEQFVNMSSSAVEQHESKLAQNVRFAQSEIEGIQEELRVATANLEDVQDKIKFSGNAGKYADELKEAQKGVDEFKGYLKDAREGLENAKREQSAFRHAKNDKRALAQWEEKERERAVVAERERKQRLERARAELSESIRKTKERLPQLKADITQAEQKWNAAAETYRNAVSSGMKRGIKKLREEVERAKGIYDRAQSSYRSAQRHIERSETVLNQQSAQEADVPF